MVEVGHADVSQGSCLTTSIEVRIALQQHSCLKLSHYDCMQAHDTAPLQQFGSQFDNVNFRKGLQLNFTSSKDGSLITQIDNKQVRDSIC